MLIWFSAVLSLATHTFAQTVASSVYVYNGGFTGSNFTFAINLAQDSQDLFFHLSGPTKFSWLAVGTGNEMTNSLMFVAYANSGGNNVTLSPRICPGKVEPIYNSSLDITLLSNTGISNNTYVVNAKCSNCRSWHSGSLDVTSKTQNFIYAVGPDGSLHSDDKEANMGRHVEWGHFTMDLTQATGSGGVPTDILNNSGSAAVGSPKPDYDWGLISHMAFMLIAFVVLFPVGYLLLRYADSVKYHWWMQSTAICVVVLGVGTGINESMLYNKSKNFGSLHQIIGLVVAGLLLPQWALGYIHHKQYPQKKRRTWITHIHLILGPTLLLTGVANGALGFMFAGMTENIIWFAIIVGIMAAIVLVMMVLKRRQRKVVQRVNVVPQHYEEGYYGALADSGHLNDPVLTHPSSHPEEYEQDEYSNSHPQQGAYVDSHPRV